MHQIAPLTTSKCKKLSLWEGDTPLPHPSPLARSARSGSVASLPRRLFFTAPLKLNPGYATAPTPTPGIYASGYKSVINQLSFGCVHHGLGGQGIHSYQLDCNWWTDNLKIHHGVQDGRRCLIVGETGSSCYNFHVFKHTMQTKRATLIIFSIGQDEYLFLSKSVKVLKFELTFLRYYVISKL